jgi:hypothetical protein
LVANPVVEITVQHDFVFGDDLPLPPSLTSPPPFDESGVPDCDLVLRASLRMLSQ